PCACSYDDVSRLFYCRPPCPTLFPYTTLFRSVVPDSGIASYTFPTLPAGWTTSGSGAARTYSYNGTPTQPGAGNNVTATNGAGLTGTARASTGLNASPSQASYAAYSKYNDVNQCA